jgi:purine nucleosidase/pyrimidine-specific ribonucleoside hydrolase
MPRPVLIDTDTGVDDALALIFALRSPEISVKAITTVAGNVQVSKCTHNVYRILQLLQVAEAPVIAQGASAPLRRRLVTAPEVHGDDGLGNAGIPLRRPARIRRDAVRMILETCERYGRRLTIIALGPLTNLALALKEDRATLSRVGRIVSMGGAFRVPGNTGPVAEFNYYVDPEAAHRVLNAGLPVTIVPLDVTQHVTLMRTEAEYRAGRRASVVAKAILRFTRFYMRYHRITEGFLGGYLHDPVAVAVALEPSIVRSRRVHVDVETKGEWTRGMTVAELRHKPRLGRTAVHVAFRIDRERFLKLFHERLWK